MSYGRAPYGQTPYGGFGLEPSGGISLTATIPTDGQTGINLAALLSFELTSTNGIDELTLEVTVNGVVVISGGGFQPGYTGFFTQDEETVFQVEFSTHVNFPDGQHVEIIINVKDLAGEDSGPLSFSFDVDADTVELSETLTLSESLGTVQHYLTPISETLSFSETLNLPAHYLLSLSESLELNETVTGLTQEATSVGTSGRVVELSLSQLLSLEGLGDIANFTFTPTDGGVPITVDTVTPLFNLLQSGDDAEIQTGLDGRSRTVVLTGGTFSEQNVGDYISIQDSPWNAEEFLKIVEVLATETVVVDQDLYYGDPDNGSFPWEHHSGAYGFTLTTSKATNGKAYRLAFSGLRNQQGRPVSGQTIFTAVAAKPKLSSASFQDDGTVIAVFAEPMRLDGAYSLPSEYSITGSSDVKVKRVTCLSPTQVALETTGFGAGSYTLTVNATGTPKDVAGNPIDPTFNTAIFTAAVPLQVRSVFTDRGPIAKPPLEIASGSTGSVVSVTDVNLPNALMGGFPTSVVGLYVTISSPTNGGTFRIARRVSGTRLSLNASFRSTEPLNGSLVWEVFDPRNGQIADDPDDVVVKINGTPVTPEAVIGLLGQVVLATAPDPEDDVKIDYSWVCNPTVDIRRLNSREFVFNSWNLDIGKIPEQHTYRYNNAMARPEGFVPDDMQAELAQPQYRELHYRAYERAYTAVLNDPNLLLFNTPNHRIAYPPLSRTINSESVQYNANELPENNVLFPWERKGSGSATVSNGVLTIQDSSSSPFPMGSPLFWTRGIDVTFPHVFAMAWRADITLTPTTEGVFTGVAAGWTTDQKAIVIGYLLDGGVKKIGFLKKGLGDATYDIGSWTGGVDDNLVSTDAPIEIDWSIRHSYRLLRDRSGTIRLYLDGDIVEVLRVTEDELPYLEELNAPFNHLEGSFFGAISRPAASTSEWDFVRYTILPTNPEQIAPAIFVNYEGGATPETASPPWTPVGYHGTETILSSDILLLDSTSATTPATSAEVGLVGGDFKGFDRIEPLLLRSSDVDLDFSVQITSHTHGIAPNAIMAAIDDGARVVQVSFLSSRSFSKFSYPGRSLPEDATPDPWVPNGGGTAEMLGRTLRITDSTVSDGLVYSLEDLAGSGPTRILGTTLDYIFEFRAKVDSYTADVSGFAGVNVEIFEGDDLGAGRVVGILLRDDSGTKKISFHSDGVLLGSSSEFTFDWDDDQFHTYKVVKSTDGDLISLFVDGLFTGSVTYSDFSFGAGNPTIVFGSATAASVLAQSVVDWAYVNVWQTTSDPVERFVGVWKGRDSDSLVGYYLPERTSGMGVLSASDTLQDLSVNFITLGVVSGDFLVIDEGPNRGSYEITSVFANAVEVLTVFPLQSTSTTVGYRIPRPIDWTSSHRYRVLRDPGGAVSVILDIEADPIIRFDYSEVTLPGSSTGVPSVLSAGLPSVVFGAFDPTNLSQSRWDYVRYGIKKSIGESRIVPGHMVLNQRNVMASPEHLTTMLAHEHTDFWSSSTGIPPKKDPDFLADSGLTAFTRLNEKTPLVPSTQTYEVRRPTPVTESIVGLNRPEDVLNNEGGFLLNDGKTITRLIVPEDVLYNALDVIEQSTGDQDLIAPFSDECGLTSLGTISMQSEICLVYEGDVLPENDTSPGTPWILDSDNPSDVSTQALSGILTYSTGSSGDQTIYRNATMIPDTTSFDTEVKFTFKVANDTTGGTGDSQIRVGFSALGITAILAFVTTGLGQRLVQLQDGPTSQTLGAIPFDYLDGNFHTYRMVRSPGSGQVQFFIDS